MEGRGGGIERKLGWRDGYKGLDGCRLWEEWGWSIGCGGVVRVVKVGVFGGYSMLVG